MSAIRCICGSDQVVRLAWCNANAEDFREWERDRNDPHNPQVRCGECDLSFMISDLDTIDEEKG